eukprot:TRINITY_DN8193_c0_g1_i7.p1 TRINITY_DN8193_c0_g1~~TRINITY_DN8193_c0_g1_i7.p1  ORF type:complete len:656 (+),score=110.61 TRINITY_DN8193_c0_g1_i7:138-2105(+)
MSVLVLAASLLSQAADNGRRTFAERRQREAELFRQRGGPAPLSEYAEAEWLRRLIPDAQLRYEFAPNWDRGNNTKPGGFPFSAHTLRQSRVLVGNTHRMRRVLRKLRNRECLRVLALGASVTAGWVTAAFVPWPANLKRLLDARWPCDDPARGHKVHCPSGAGTTSQWAVDTFELHVRSCSEYNRMLDRSFPGVYCLHDDDKIEYDMAIVEYGTMDKAFPLTSVREWTEALAIKLLSLRAPEPLAVLWFSAMLVGAGLSRNLTRAVHEYDLAQLYVEAAYLPVLMHHELPLVSAAVPLAGRRNGSRPIAYWAPYPHLNMDNIHPRPPLSRFFALVVFNYFAEEMDRPEGEAQGLPDADLSLAYGRALRAPGLPSGTLPRAPLLLSADRLRRVLSTPKIVMFTGRETARGSWSSPNHGWVHKADNRRKDKYGLVARHTGARLVIPVTLREQSRHVTVYYLSTYANVSSAVAWFSRDPSERAGSCAAPLTLCQVWGCNCSEWKRLWAHIVVQYPLSNLREDTTGDWYNSSYGQSVRPPTPRIAPPLVQSATDLAVEWGSQNCNRVHKNRIPAGSLKYPYRELQRRLRSRTAPLGGESWYWLNGKGSAVINFSSARTTPMHSSFTGPAYLHICLANFDWPQQMQGEAGRFKVLAVSSG